MNSILGVLCMINMIFFDSFYPFYHNSSLESQLNSSFLRNILLSRTCWAYLDNYLLVIRPIHYCFDQQKMRNLSFFSLWFWENRTEFQKANGQLLLHVTHLKLSNDLVTLTFTESDAAAKTSATINARHAPIYRVSEIHLCKCEWNIIIGKLLGQCEERKAKALFIMLLFRKFQIATVHKRRHTFFEIFDPLPPSSSLLLNNLY